MKRRSFLKTVGGVVGTCALGIDNPLGGSAAEASAAGGELPRRVLGRTGARVSVVVFLLLLLLLLLLMLLMLLLLLLLLVLV